jgi:hypothetical protein
VLEEENILLLCLQIFIYLLYNSISLHPQTLNVWASLPQWPSLSATQPGTRVDH